MHAGKAGESALVTRWAIRLTLAYALLLQLVLGTTAGALHSLSFLDPLAITLCTPSDDGKGSPAGAPGGHAHDLLCCTLGCAAAQPAPGIDVAGGSIPLAPRGGGIPLATSAHEAAHASGAPASFEARGPPARA